MFSDEIHMDPSQLRGQERFQRYLSHRFVRCEDRVRTLPATLLSKEIQTETRHCVNQFSFASLAIGVW